MQVFVYGTLKKGFPAHSLLKDSKFITKYITSNEFSMYDMGYYPAVTHGGNTAITGEIYDVNAEILKEIDRYEGHPKHFRRVKLPYTLYNKPIYIYLYQYKFYNRKPMDKGIWNNT